MATVTPRKLVHWDLNNVSFSDLGSPFFDTSSSDSIVSTASSLAYINSQLIAHGFAPSPGLSLDGISGTDSERVIKCLLAMLSQRVEDMSRTEELTTRLRTLTYDHQRLMSMHHTTTEKAANAEREMNLHKTRLAATTRTLQSTEAAHKHTTAELQRTRTALQGVRAAHQSELRKKEKDVERMSEKWTKLAEAQTKLLSAPSGMIRCANVGIVDGLEVLGKGQGYLEVALEQAEKACSELGEDNLKLRKLVLSAVNEVQSVVHQAKGTISNNELDKPTPFTLTTLFPMNPPSAASDNLTSVLATLRDSLNGLLRPTIITPASKPIAAPQDSELERLQNIITALRAEIERSQKQAIAHAAETQAMFDKFAQDHRVVTGDIGEMSVELMSAPLRDAEKERLDCLKKELGEERRKFTEAAIKLGKERAAIEAERIKLLDEKRSWEVEMMLAELPPTPQPATTQAAPPIRILALNNNISNTATSTAIQRKFPHSPKKSSPRKSPSKPISVGKARSSTRKGTRVSRRSSLASPIKVQLAYETEVMLPLPALAFSNPDPAAQSFGLGASSFLPTSFVLPPPSPRTSFPPQPALLSSFNPLDAPEFTLANDDAEDISSPPPPTPGSSTAPEPLDEPISVPPPLPSTPPKPVRRPFPVAKPFAARMIHAYSPAKPSPLSRILMLSDSPTSPDSNFSGHSKDWDSLSSGSLGALLEEDEGSGGEPFDPPPPLPKQMSLAEELGVPESPPEPEERKIAAVVVLPRPPKLTGGKGVATAKGRTIIQPELNRLTAKEKEKGKARGEGAPGAPVGTSARARTSAGAAIEKEKENDIGMKRNVKVFSAPPPRPAVAKTGSGGSRVSPPMGGEARLKPVGPPVKAAAAGASSSRARLAAKLPPPLGKTSGGPRRVLVDSVEAPPIGKVRKG